MPTRRISSSTISLYSLTKWVKSFKCLKLGVNVVLQMVTHLFGFEEEDCEECECDECEEEE